MAQTCQGRSTLIDKPHRIFAESVPLAGALEVLVYRSIQIRDRHKVFNPVLDIVKDAVPLIRQLIEDESMIMGAAEILVYLVNSDPEVIAA